MRLPKKCTLGGNYSGSAGTYFVDYAGCGHADIYSRAVNALLMNVMNDATRLVERIIR